MTEKSRTDHRERAVYVYVRQSSLQHVRQHRDSQQRQDGLADRARPLGCIRVVVIDVAMRDFIVRLPEQRLLTFD